VSAPLILQRTAQVDATVTEAFGSTQPPVTVVAVGGYGRRELFPYSDVDLLLLSSGKTEGVAEFLRILWDQGLRIGQSLHTPADCCEIHEGNLELTISLLDQRYLCGDETPYRELQKLFPKFVTTHRDDIVAHLAAMTRGRHAKYGNTIYHLEPNVKEFPGGLRDIHVMHWLHQLGCGNLEACDEARAFLFDLRIRLHEYFKRDNNTLTFEAQDQLSDHPAQFMRNYYRHARQIDHSVQRLLELSEPASRSLFAQFREWRSRLSTSEFTVSRERVLLRNPAQLETDPSVIPRLAIFMARHQIALAPDTEARLQRAPAFQWSWSELRVLLSLPRCANALHALADLNLLERMIPEWQRIDCLVVRDFYHRYTVDEHTLVTLEALENLAFGEDPRPARFARLLNETDHPEILRLALLLHDIGKGEGAGDHATRSVEIARVALDRLKVPERDQATVLFLIEHHLDLSSIMTSRDLSEPSTAFQIAAASGTIEQLKLLTLLTFADISAVNPTAMTDWRMEQLWQTYLVGHQEFTRELEAERIQTSQVSADAAAFLDGFPTRYLKTHTPAQIAGHLDLARHGNAVEVVRVNGTYRVTVVAQDRPFLLASLSGALASFGMNILKAEAFANSRGQALDTFVFDDPHRTLELNPGEAERLHDVVQNAMLGQLDVDKLMQKRRRVVTQPRIAPTISFNNELSETSTLVEIVAEDRPALLYDLTNAISIQGANIEVVLIDTEAHRALDVFYVTANGGKLSSEQMIELKARLFDVCRS
jgi:[protein-PII] uridylyltransferase